MDSWQKKQNKLLSWQLAEIRTCIKEGENAKSKARPGMHSKFRIREFVPLDSISPNLQRMTPIKMLNINKTSANSLQNEF